MKLELDQHYTGVLKRALIEYIRHVKDMNEVADAGVILGRVHYAERKKD